MNVYIVYNKFCFNLVGCKISVPESDKMKATQPGFWPSEITCRVWEKFKPGLNKSNGFNYDVDGNDNNQGSRRSGTITRTVYNDGRH